MSDEATPALEPKLDERMRQVVSWVVGGMAGPAAFRKAGFAPSYCRKASVVLKRPAYIAAIEQERASLREITGYGPENAVKEIDRQIKGALAAKNPNHMAAAKLLELKCKIFGLVREKVEVTSIDLFSAIEKAKNRVVDVSPPPRLPVESDHDVEAQLYLGPGVRGDALADLPPHSTSR